ncbi:tRNA (adenosine(37)-N6)-threonylcarbamoyltransferase complex ATPase subunit type 1 TsaE [Sinomonas sp. ASV322]|uniref:tRNA (adenosine(37)-N6)-threonylcarbamoyltransferase complex ATPase subunit type 1 TsaE n=1 Tax=Sinomonas sp. ASV322 TaxID=3041920 RepID=UPI0027DDEFE9|nr:tRNA (adenosine(37)-N6)-threonylcarbamoyltransferase complex ATPase subunit type 1 TsaE [Sinomonas sp. ASV322]MDQ4501931.1 tRNA (adenosine(37)-N6)-threonylcarbamoyltransferase complex ATPase subunit type 1 TsaE [Sinomonas sp. ASV322]
MHPASAPDAAWELRARPTTAEETQALGSALGEVLRAGDLVVLTGGLGAGKTTFTQGLGAGLGVRGGVISPTFVLVRIHPNLPSGPRPGGPDLVHVDAYRLEGEDEIDDLDLENWADTSVTVVEWGRGRVEHLAESWLDIELVRGPAGDPPGETAVGSAVGADPDVDFDPQFADASVDEEYDDDEPRLVVVRGFGPRWAELPALPGAEQASAWTGGAR